MTMTKDEAAPLLRQFCADGKETAKPFVFRGWNVATDGKILAAIPGAPDDSTPSIDLSPYWTEMHRAANDGPLLPLPAFPVDAVPVLTRCSSCSGKGSTPARLECETCDGTGDCLHCGHECDQCDGEGTIEADYPGEPCNSCRGTGKHHEWPPMCLLASRVVGVAYASQLIALRASVRWSDRFLVWQAGPMTGLLMPISDDKGELAADCRRRGAVLL